MNKYKIYITRHAREKMNYLGISNNDIEKAILMGMKSKQTDGFLSCYTYYCVAYKIMGDKAYKVKTVYISSRK